MTLAISWLFLIYFIVLYVERIRSLVKTGREMLFSSKYLIYVDSLAICSLIATTIMLLTINSNFWLSLFDNSILPDYKILSITAGVVLVSGMVHTEHTIAPVQFGAYGALIIALVLRTIMVAKTGTDLLTLWYSLGFITVFSMAIPVVYPTKMKMAALFVTIEAIVSLALVISFTLMLVALMCGNGDHLLWWIPTMIVLIGDSAIIAMQWKEGANYFVMVFAIITIIMFAIGKGLLHI